MALPQESVTSSRIDPYGNATERRASERRASTNVTESRSCEANVFLQPVAPPSILGMFAFAGSTFLFGAWLAGWYGSAFSPFYIAPFAGIFGGAAQLVAAVWSYRARDGMATAIHGTWGAFFLGFGLLYAMFLFQPQFIPMGQVFPELGFWFIVVAAISWCLSLAAMAQRLALAAVVMSVSGAATFGAIGFLTGITWCGILSGYLFLLSALCGLYDAMAHVLKEVYGHEVLKLGYSEKVLSEPGIMVGTGEPGVIHGQR